LAPRLRHGRAKCTVATRSSLLSHLPVAGVPAEATLPIASPMAPPDAAAGCMMRGLTPLTSAQGVKNLRVWA
ncbi:hypothetical protein Hamer_G020454, partial [Homarus americanus]